MIDLKTKKIKELRQNLTELRNNGAEIEDIANLIYEIQLEEEKIKHRKDYRIKNEK